MTVIQLTAPNVPNADTVVSRVWQAMAANHTSTTRASKSVGVHAALYRLVRKLLILQDQDVLNEQEREQVHKALALSNQRKFTEAELTVKEVLRKHWHFGSRVGTLVEQQKLDRRIVKKQKERFDNTLFAIRAACTNNEEMVIPKLTNEQRVEARKILMESQSALWNLFAKVNDE